MLDTLGGFPCPRLSGVFARVTPAERRRVMLEGPVVSTILTLAAPNVLNVAAQSLVSIADGLYVGRLVAEVQAVETGKIVFGLGHN